jgi:hypothetical protein
VTRRKWRTSSDPVKMLAAVHGKVSDRKLRLLAVACCRRVWEYLDQENSRRAIETASRVVEGVATAEELAAAHQAGYEIDHSGSINLPYAAAHSANPTITDQARGLRQILVNLAAGATGGPPSTRVPNALMARLFRCIAGNPFRPLALPPDLRTPTVVALARAAYEELLLPSGELEPARLAVLGDALEETGCDDVTVLTHLHDPGPHVRGCFVVDWVLDRE